MYAYKHVHALRWAECDLDLASDAMCELWSPSFWSLPGLSVERLV